MLLHRTRLAWTYDAVNDLTNDERCLAVLEVLSFYKDAQGRSLRVHKFPLPTPLLQYSKQEAESLNRRAFAVRQKDDKMAAS